MSTKKRFILVEDDTTKIQDVKSFISEQSYFDSITVKESYQTGLREVLKGDYDILLLDMSIPTWDRTPIENGGNYQKFGGYMILKEMIRKKVFVPTILITMFDDFGEGTTSVTLEQLDSILSEQFPQVYKGAVYYSSRQSSWKEKLTNLISDIK